MCVSVGLLVLVLRTTCSFGVYITDTNSISGQFPQYLGAYTNDVWSGYSLDPSLGDVGSVSQYQALDSQWRPPYDGILSNSHHFPSQDTSPSLNGAGLFNGGSFSSSLRGPQSSGFFTSDLTSNNPTGFTGHVTPFPSDMISPGFPTADNTFSNSLAGNSISSGFLGSSFGSELGMNTFQDRFRGFTSDRQLTDTFAGAGVRSGFRSGNLRSAINDITSALVQGFGSSGRISSSPVIDGGINTGLDLLSPSNIQPDSVLRGLSMPLGQQSQNIGMF